jgi:hypothetical protein
MILREVAQYFNKPTSGYPRENTTETTKSLVWSEDMDKADPRCSCLHHQVAPAALVLIGLAFLGNALGWLSDTLLTLSWPTLLVIAGLAKLTGPRCRCCTH